MKLVWSSQSELVNDFLGFDWRPLRGVVCTCSLRRPTTWISANDVSRSSPIDDRRYVFSRLRVEKERSGVAVVAGLQCLTDWCFVFALTLPRRESADNQRFKLQDKS